MVQRQNHQARRIRMSVVGVLVCGIGVGFFKFASFGVDPFQSLMSGLASAVPISFGLLYLLANALLLLVSVIFDRSKIGIATIINLTILGYMVDFSHRTLLALLPQATLALRIVSLIVGILVLCVASALYFTANLGVSTYDAIALMLSQRFSSVPFRFFRIGTDLICVASGVTLFLLSGGTVENLGQVVGVGTIITAFCMGPLIEVCNRYIAEPLLNRP